MKYAKGLFFLGVLLSLFVLSDLVLWWYLSAKSLSFEETKALYLSYFPAWSRNARYLTGLFIIINIAAMYVIGKAIAFLGKNYRGAGILFMILNALMLALKLWSLM